MKKMLISLSCILLSIILVPCSIKVNALSSDEITAPSCVLMEAETGQILFEKNPHEIRPCASITKVMTLILVMEAIDSGIISLNDQLAASAHAASMGGSDIWLEPGEVMNVNDLIKATVVASANDAAVVLAEKISGSESEFVEQMNNKAKNLGMNDTTFKNCNGLDEEGHLTSAYDVALMSRELIKHDEIFNYTSIWMDNLRNGKTQIVNTNKLLKSYSGITGLKTGTTSAAGSCITATANRNNLNLIAVVLGSATGKDRFSDATKLLDYGFANFEITNIEPDETQLHPIVVNNGMEQFVDVEATDSGEIVLPKGKQKNLTSEIELYDSVDAPIYKGQVLGTMVYKLDDNVLFEIKIKSSEDIDKISFKGILSVLFKELISL